MLPRVIPSIIRSTDDAVLLMAYEISLPNDVVISDDRARLDMAFIHDALADAYWAIGRPRSLTERSIAHCLCFGVYAQGKEQIGFARLLTDYSFRAHLSDVVITQSMRGRGLGKALITAVLAHPELTTVTRWTLVTADAQGLYEQFGFRTTDARDQSMTMIKS